MTDLNSKLRGLIALRLLIVVSITASYGLYRMGMDESAVTLGGEDLVTRGDAVVSMFVLACVQTLIYIGLLLGPLRRYPTGLAYCQFVGDILLITFLMYQLGPAAESFSVLYFVTISLASVLLRRSAGIVVATLAALCLTVMVWSPSWALLDFVLNYLGLSGTSPLGNLPLANRVYVQSIHVAGFYAVAILTSYLARDVTRAEERLRAKQIDLAYLEVAHRDVIQSISSGLATTDLNGIVTSLNKPGEGIFEAAEEDLVGVHITETDLFDAESWNQLTEFSTNGTLQTEIQKLQDDRTLHLGFTLSHLRSADDERRGYILVVEDLTQERELQEQLRLKDRMAAIGEMATKLAHEVGNPLAAISGSVQVLAGSFQGDTSQRKLLEITLKESRRLDRIVKSFLQLASSRQRRLARVDVAALLAEDTELLRNSDEVHEHHRIEDDIHPASALIRADPDQIGQIFWNLARNALRAMPEGGKLRVVGRLDQSAYRLEFQDTGSGMTEEEKADLFHPFKSFFDHGTGIGMAIVYRIVQEHGGTILAESNRGRGTVIRIELPVSGPSENPDSLYETQRTEMGEAT